jgi:hypothetical protein
MGTVLGLGFRDVQTEPSPWRCSGKRIAVGPVAVLVLVAELIGADADLGVRHEQVAVLGCARPVDQDQAERVNHGGLVE